VNILVDDLRSRDDVDIICRTIKAAKLVVEAVAISRNHLDATLYLDHDMAGGEGEDGIDLLIWARDNDVALPLKIVFVSENIVGCRNMKNLLIHDLCYNSDLSGMVFYHD